MKLRTRLFQLSTLATFGALTMVAALSLCGNPSSVHAEGRAARAAIETAREKVAALKKQGRSLDEAIAAKPTAAYDAKWGRFLITPAMFTGLVYQGV